MPRPIAGVLKSFPRRFQENPLLRIHEPRFMRRILEEAGVKPVIVGQERRGLHVRRIAEERFRDPRRQDFLV